MILPFLKARIGGANIDMMPNPFSFATVNGQTPNTATFAVARITGISVPVPVRCDAHQFRILDETGTVALSGWVTSGVTVKNNQHVQLYITSSNAYSGVTAMTVYVGKGSASWYVYTMGVTGGSAGWGSPGTYWYTIPHHNQFNFDVYGSGGGGGGAPGQSANTPPFVHSAGDGAAGGYCQIYDEETGGGKVNVIGWAGGGGQGAYYNGAGWPNAAFVNGAGGGHGSAQGGDGNIPGGGAGGGAGGYYQGPTPGYSGAGGTGGRAYRSTYRGLLTPGTRLVIVVQGGGSPGADAYNEYGGGRAGGGWGGQGACYISWG